METDLLLKDLTWIRELLDIPKAGLQSIVNNHAPQVIARSIEDE